MTGLGKCPMGIGDASAVNRYVQVQEKMPEEGEFEQLIFPHINSGMVNIEYTKNDVQVRSMVTHDHAGTGKVIGFVLVGDLREKPGAVSDAAGPHPF